MNILFINGSPRAHGNTEKALKQCEKEITDCLGADNASFVYIDLAKYNIMQCAGCRACFNLGEDRCPHLDEVSQISKMMEEAAAIIIGSPVYVEDISGIMKTWIDRMGYHCHRPFLQGKPVYVLTTSGAGASAHAAKTIVHAVTSWGAAVIGWENYSMGAQISSINSMDTLTICKRMKKICYNLKQQKIPLFSLIGFRVQQKYWKQKQADCPVDYQYWMEMGWFEKKCTYYKPININIFKKMMINLLAMVAGRIVTPK